MCIREGRTGEVSDREHVIDSWIGQLAIGKIHGMEQLLLLPLALLTLQGEEEQGPWCCPWAAYKMVVPCVLMGQLAQEAGWCTAAWSW